MKLILALAAFLLVTRFALAGEQTPQTLHKKVERNVDLHYLLYLPKTYATDDKQHWPLVIFLHGAGERGNDLELLKRHGPPKLVAQGKDFPFVLVSPQCPADTRWNIPDLDALLDDIIDRYRIDSDRVYVTGLSMGGMGTWRWITEHPERFAAAIPICGAGDPFLVNWKKVPPVWAFHGEADPTVSVEESKRMVDAMLKHGGDAKLTIYPGITHDSWTATYDNPAVYEWLLSHKRKNNP